MSDDILVKVDNVSKRFCRSLKRSLWYGLQDLGSEIGGHRHGGGSGLSQSSGDVQMRPDEFWAVKSLSFELRRGECLGLIGRNGAGKTTLLKILNGLIKPDSGLVTLRGRVGALIALGSGFNPILTGLENIYINGSVMGLSKQEIDEKIDEIIDFSGIGEFINTPVQNYSSGMSVRLGFGIASALKPDILLVDEVLAVGDSAFKVRCYNKIKELLPNAAVILVSHNMFDISRVATQVSVVDKGREVFHGSVEAGVHLYNELNNEDNSVGDSTRIVTHSDKGITGVNVKKFEYETSGISTKLVLEFGCKSEADIGLVRIRLVFFDISQAPIAEWDSLHHGISYVLRAGLNNYSVAITNIRLVSGFYRVAVVLTDKKNNGYWAGVEYGLNMKINSIAIAGAPYKI